MKSEPPKSQSEKYQFFYSRQQDKNTFFCDCRSIFVREKFSFSGSVTGVESYFRRGGGVQKRSTAQKHSIRAKRPSTVA